jgi:hypothetical protein
MEIQERFSRKQTLIKPLEGATFGTKRTPKKVRQEAIFGQERTPGNSDKLLSCQRAEEKIDE